MARRKGSQLPQVMLLKHIIRGCQRFALFSRKNRYLAFECDEEKAYCGLPTDVPKGHIPVYVGNERSRFIIPTTYLNHPLFRALLQKAEEEFGFDHQLGLTIPCDENVFEYLTSLLGKKDTALTNLKLKELIMNIDF
eukprot:Gb_02943 [translate_table: standard]